MHASIYILYIQLVLLNVALEPLKSWGGSFLLIILFAFIFVHFKCTLFRLSLPLGTIKSKKNFKRFKWYIWGNLWEVWWAIGKSNWPQQTNHWQTCSVLAVMASSLWMCVCFHDHIMVFPFFPVFWSKQIGHLTMTSLCKTLGQRGNVSWQNE